MLMVELSLIFRSLRIIPFIPYSQLVSFNCCMPREVSDRTKAAAILLFGLGLLLTAYWLPGMQGGE